MKYDRDVKTLIVGFGFSCVALLRELDRTGEDYLIISEKIPNPIWANLKRNGRLDFDLVSSYNTSFYSFDQAERFTSGNGFVDGYPIASEYHDMHLAYHEKYKDRIVGDDVTRIDNHEGFSLVHTGSGTVYRAENVVVSTGFRRNIHNALNEFEYAISGKTVVFNTIGDSSNLMIAKLVAKKNRIICLGNGFNALDKMFQINKQTVTLDQIEYHNIAFLFPNIYRAMISGNSVFPLVMLALSFIHTRLGRLLYGAFLSIGKFISPSLFAFAYPQTIRPLRVNLKRFRKAMPFPNGVIAIKYWPVDGYSKFFGNNLKESIRKGYLLNDLPMFIDQGLVEYWSKKEVEVDHERKIVRNKVTGHEVSFDHFIDGGPENPRLPQIVNYANGPPSIHEYVYRENYLGSVPKRLSNVFFIGYTRPTTGGLANITEMQCLLVHKLIFSAAFKNSVYDTIEARLEAYNTRYYYTDEPTKTDHLVFYGFYTEEVARAIGIDVKLSSCRSFRDVSKYVFFPNNAFKYRQKGEYRVDGCAELVEHIDCEHHRWAGLKMRFLTFGMYHAMLFTTMLMLYLKQSIGLPVFALVTLAQYLFSFVFVTPTVHSQSFIASAPYSYLRLSLLVAGFAAIVTWGPVCYLPVMAADFLLSYLVRAFLPERARLTFNDLKIKRRYKPFLNLYLETYRELFPVR
jgi:hypothetical protein